MTPGSSVCGLYLVPPAARYFGVGRIGADQLEDYAAPQGLDDRRGRRWLAPILDDERASCRRRPERRGAQARSPAATSSTAAPLKRPARRSSRACGAAASG